jgi:hypothetical protein
VTTRIFTRDQLEAWDLPDAWADDSPEILYREQVDARRWVSVHELVFRAPDDGLAYRVFYEQGLTEDQDDTDPWNGDDEVKAAEVEQRPVVTRQWRDVNAPADPGLDVVLPAWEAMYEPGNVSDYLIGYANSEAAAKGAAEAWLRSEKDEPGRLEWLPQNPVDGYDTEFELVEHHDDGIDTGPGITVRHRTQRPTT